MSQNGNINDTLIYRINKRMTQRKTNATNVALAAGLGKTAVRDIIARKSKSPALDTLVKIAKALECSVSYLLGEDDTGGELQPPIAIAIPTSLAGMFFLLDTGEYHRTGELVSEVSDGVFLTRPDNMDNRKAQNHFTLLSLGDMLGETPDDLPTCTLFSSREELEKYVTWMHSPEESRVINLVKK